MKIQLIDVAKSFKQDKIKRQVLGPINLTISDSQFVAITGKSGSGKSTLLNMIGGIDRPSSGQILYDDLNIVKLSDTSLSRLRGKEVGFVFQSYYLQPSLSVLDNIILPGLFVGKKRRELIQKATKIAQILDIDTYLHSKPLKLSGGQAQRAAICRAVINNPNVLIADEPTGNLDSENSKNVLKLLIALKKQLGITIILVTHDLDLAKHAERIVEISDGRIVKDGLTGNSNE